MGKQHLKKDTKQHLKKDTKQLLKKDTKGIQKKDTKQIIVTKNQKEITRQEMLNRNNTIFDFKEEIDGTNKKVKIERRIKEEIDEKKKKENGGKKKKKKKKKKS